MKKGLDLMDLISKVMVGIVFLLFIISFFIPNGRVVFLIAFGLFFVFPLFEQLLFYYYKFLYRNIEIAKGHLDEEKGVFEKIKWRIIKVISLDLLPEIMHKKYTQMIDTNYRNVLRDQSFKELDQFLLMDKQIEDKQGEIDQENEEVEEEDG